MKAIKLVLLFNLAMLTLLTTGCRRNSNSVWDDTRSAGRHMGRGIRSLGGKNGDSRMICSRDQFGNPIYVTDCPGGYAGDFIPLEGDPNAGDLAMAEMIAPPPRETPGDPGSSLPGIEAFQDPSTNPEWSHTFRNIHFPYNSSLVKGPENMETLKDIANYMRSRQNVYIFVEGHCDERGPEAYNLSLGSHRSNAVRNLLINEGVNPNNIFTISYGKERPLVYGQGEESWWQNRRAEFKVFMR